MESATPTNTLIIYGSQYGTTKRYAEKLSELMGFPIINYKTIKDLTDYDCIIHLGGLYAGGVKGLKSTVRMIKENKKLIIITVGLADVCDEKNINNIRRHIRKQLPEKLFKNAAIFHLRGGIDYQKLSFKHKTMMTLLYNKAKRLPEDEKTPEIRALIETFNSKVDFVDYDSLIPIIKSIT